METLAWRQKTRNLCLCVSTSHTHTHTHTHPRTQRAGAPSTRKETEIGNKDHPLCLRTVNGSSNVFNLSPESNNGAHSTPPRYCSTVRLKALGFHHPSLSQFLSPFPPNLCVPFMKGLICGIRRQGGLVEKKKKKKKKRRRIMLRRRINGWRGERRDEYTSVFDSGPPSRLNDTCSKPFHSFTQSKDSISQLRLSLVIDRPSSLSALTLPGLILPRLGNKG